MKLSRIVISLAAAAIAAAAGTPELAAADFREHRGVYISPYVADWPSNGITDANAEIHKRYLRQALDRLAANGINVVYFAVRPLCDAAYRSKYEPWSQCVSSRRGVEPPFDPLQFLIDESHARGIEVYTWLNAYRYCTTYKHGESPLDYELTHPEWLLVQQHETILNPALEEVKQRVCDVAADIVDNYDIDGFLFDDYYYSNPTPFEVDAEWYNAAKEADPSIGSQIEWRVANVTSMIERVSKVVKSHKPWVVFGIKPAGVASPPNIRDYGLEPSPDIRELDWQYNAVAADPIQWYSKHLCDFMAPQIYWCDLFDPLQDWWVIASRKFDRHLYSAVSMAKYSYFGGPEFAREAEYSRAGQADNINGIGFFRYNYYMNEVTKVDGKVIDFPEYMGSTAFATHTLAPVRPWNNVYSPAYVENLRRDGSTLRWDAVEGMRYVIYAFRAGEEQKPFNTNMVQVRYQADFEIPEDMTDRIFGVSVYDRYGNEYPMSVEGAPRAEAVVPRLLYPADGQQAADLFDFSWEDTGCDNILEVATDPEFENCIVKLPTSRSSMNSFVVNNLAEGTTYWWRVRANAPNAPVGVSEVRSFVASRLAVISPTGDENVNTPTVTWTPAYDGAVYTVEISADSDFKKIDFTATTDATSVEVGPNILYTGYRYWCRVRAEREGRSSLSDAVIFRTSDVVVDKPQFINPAADGVTLHANQAIEVAPVNGAASILLQICENADFSGSFYRNTLINGDVTSPLLSKVRIKGKKLVDGTTYYVRACSRYFVQSDATAPNETEFSISSFVYSSTDGVADYVADGAEVTLSPEGLLSMPAEGNAVAVYLPDGTCVLSVAAAAAEIDLSHLAPGLYIVSVNGFSPATIKWLKK